MLMPATAVANTSYSHVSVPMKCFAGIKGGVYYLVQTEEQFQAVIAAAKRQRALVIDTETSGLNWVKADVAGVVIGFGVSDNYYIPIGHRCSQDCCMGDFTHEQQLTPMMVLPALQELMADPEITKIFWNAKFDMHMLAKLGVTIVAGVIHDGVVLAHLLDENVSHELKDMSNALIDDKADQLEKVCKAWRDNEAKRRRSAYAVLLKQRVDTILKSSGKKVFIDKEEKKAVTFAAKEQAKEELKSHIHSRNKIDEITYDFIPLDIIAPYACADTHYTYILYKRFVSMVAGHADLRRLYGHEMQLTRVLFEMEHSGAKIDRAYLTALGPKLQDNIDKAEKVVYDAIGYKFNIGSDDQLRDALLKAGVKLTKLTKGGAAKRRQKLPVTASDYSVDKEVLEFMAAEYPFADKVQNYRQAQKIKGTYQEGILDLLDAEDFLHSSFNQNVTTGRMSSKEPNVQNIPSRDKTIRKAFIIPNDEYVMVFIDFSQVELRLTAHHSQDPVLLSCYPFEGPGQDVHSITCAEIVMGITLEELARRKNDKTGHIANDNSIEVCECNYCVVDFMRTIAKRVNFGIIYGAMGPTIARQVSKPNRPVSGEQCEEYIKKYFQKYRGVKEWISYICQIARRNGYVQNSFGRFRRIPLIKSKNRWERERAERQFVNFMIQGDAADVFKESFVRVDKIFKREKAKSRIINVVHDEIQFYWHKKELGLLKEVKQEMENFPQFSVPLIAEISYSTRDWGSKRALKV
jgi:DNA polymerase I-like protein with 3'-5' exonuclease and polymerase domains